MRADGIRHELTFLAFFCYAYKKMIYICSVKQNAEMKPLSQTDQVIKALQDEGGYATFKRLNEILDFSTWKTKTPEASVRRIVQESEQIFRIRPGLWALKEMRDEVLMKFELKEGDSKSEDKFTHGYYQGLLVEIGKYRRFKTYVPAYVISVPEIQKVLCRLRPDLNG